MNRVVLVGWASFHHGEATAGDVESLRVASAWLRAAGYLCDVVLSPSMAVDGFITEAEVNPVDYSYLVFVCGPLTGWQVRELHTRFHHCRRLAVGVSVPNPNDPAASGFHRIIARDGPQLTPTLDLACFAEPGPTAPVIGVCLANEQPEYGTSQRHRNVSDQLTSWLNRLDVATVPLNTRLDRGDWRLACNPAQLDALLRRLDVVVTTRLHGLVLG